MQLTKTEKEIIYYLNTEFLTVRQIAIRRGTSTRAVYKIIAKLKGKGAVNPLNKQVHKNRGTTPELGEAPPKIRLHGQEFNIRILWASEFYYKLVTKSNLIYVDSNTIKLYKKSIEVYSAKEFVAETEQEAYKESLKYFRTLWAKIENQLKILIVKNKYQNIKEVKSHYAQTNNELAKEANKEGAGVSFKGKDGKEWLKSDRSFNVDELETVHPQEAKADMAEAVRPYFTDLRENKPLLNSEIQTIINEILVLQKEATKHNTETAAGLNAITSIIKATLTPNKQAEDTAQEKLGPDYFG